MKKIKKKILFEFSFLDSPKSKITFDPPVPIKDSDLDKLTIICEIEGIDPTDIPKVEYMLNDIVFKETSICTGKQKRKKNSISFSSKFSSLNCSGENFLNFNIFFSIRWFLKWCSGNNLMHCLCVRQWEKILYSLRKFWSF